MKFHVKYLDKDVLEKDLSKPKQVTAKLLQTAEDRNWSYYFQKSKDIITDDYKIAYHKDKSIPGRKRLGTDNFLVIEVGGELVFVDSYGLLRIWSIEGQLKGDTFLEQMDDIFRNKMPQDGYFYHWGSCIDRIKLLNKHNEYEWLEIDKVLRREDRINQILDNNGI